MCVFVRRVFSRGKSVPVKFRIAGDEPTGFNMSGWTLRLQSASCTSFEVDDALVETIVAELRKIAAEPVPADELEKARNSAKGRFVLQLESPHGTILFGLRREVLEGEAIDPADVLAGLDAVTAEDVQRVAQDVIGGNALNLALIGPFDDAERFRALLG